MLTADKTWRGRTGNQNSTNNQISSSQTFFDSLALLNSA
jgi:hypothetical protein